MYHFIIFYLTLLQIEVGGCIKIYSFLTSKSLKKKKKKGIYLEFFRIRSNIIYRLNSDTILLYIVF